MCQALVMEATAPSSIDLSVMYSVLCCNFLFCSCEFCWGKRPPLTASLGHCLTGITETRPIVKVNSFYRRSELSNNWKNGAERFELPSDGEEVPGPPRCRPSSFFGRQGRDRVLVSQWLSWQWCIMIKWPTQFDEEVVTLGPLLWLPATPASRLVLFANQRKQSNKAQ